jgi:hypothetical protein
MFLILSGMQHIQEVVSSAETDPPTIALGNIALTVCLFPGARKSAASLWGCHVPFCDL